MTQQEIKIENKPIYCNAWTSNISDKVMCNTIPCCGYCVHGRTDKVLNGFIVTDKVGKHQAPYYNDMRKEKKENWISINDSLPEPRVKVNAACISEDMSKIIWESIGSISPSGIWCVKASESATQRKVFDNKLTHWKPL